MRSVSHQMNAAKCVFRVIVTGDFTKA
jgi:hypothetical protein